MAQNIILCQFCEISKEIAWKCFNCDLVLCQKCTKKHSKFGGSEEHCIIELKEIGTPENVEIIRRFNLRNIRCTTHKEERCSLFCRDCKKPVCSFCLIESKHKRHKIEKINWVYNNQLSNLKSIKERIKRDLPDISNSVLKCVATSDKYFETKEKIIEREKEIKKEATEKAAYLIELLDELIIPSEVTFMKEKEKIQDKERTMQNTNTEIDAALQSYHATDVLATFDKVEKHLPLKVNPDNIPLEQHFAFIVPDLPSINFGSLRTCPVLKVLNTYETNVPCINKLKSLEDGTLVCIYEKSEEKHYLGYCEEQGDKFIIKNEIFVPSEILFSYGDMTVTEDDLILITPGYNGIRCINAHDEKLQWFSISNEPEGPCYMVKNGIHYDSFDQTILFGFEEYVEIECLEFPGWGGVMILDKNGQHLKTLMYKDLDPYFSDDRIMKLTKNTNGDVIIMCKTYLIIFDSNFKLKRTLTYKNFDCPNDIVTTPNGLIVVSDTNSVDVLSMDGDLLASIGELEGIHHSTCVHIDKKGQLLVGCIGQENENAKVHVVEICN